MTICYLTLSVKLVTMEKSAGSKEVCRTTISHRQPLLTESWTIQCCICARFHKQYGEAGSWWQVLTQFWCWVSTQNIDCPFAFTPAAWHIYLFQHCCDVSATTSKQWIFPSSSNLFIVFHTNFTPSLGTMLTGRKVSNSTTTFVNKFIRPWFNFSSSKVSFDYQWDEYQTLLLWKMKAILESKAICAQSCSYEC